MGLDNSVVIAGGGGKRGLSGHGKNTIKKFKKRHFLICISAYSLFSTCVLLESLLNATSNQSLPKGNSNSGKIL